MKRCVTMIMVLVVAFNVFALSTNNSFIATESSGDWDIASNWAFGRIPGDNDYAIISSSKTAIIPSGVTAAPQRLGIGYNGVVEVSSNAVVNTGWNGCYVGSWFGSGGTLKILGGQLGSSIDREYVYLGESNTVCHGNFEIGTGDTGGTAYLNNLWAFAPTNGAAVCSIALNDGMLDANYVQIGSYEFGDPEDVKLIVNGGTLGTGNFKSAGSIIEINGSKADINIGGYLTLGEYTDLNFNFDDSGVSTVDITGPLYCGWHVGLNITGTENVPSGTYPLFTARAADSYEQRVSVNIDTNSFGGSQVNLIFDNSDGAVLALEVISAQAGYDLWSSTYGLSGDTTDDDDGDGLSNVYEYGLGGDPTNSASTGTLPTMTVSNGVASYAHVLLTDSNADVTYTVEQTTDLVNQAWSNAGWTVVATNTTGDADFDEIVYQIDDGDNRFFRLNIIQQQ